MKKNEGANCAAVHVSKLIINLIKFKTKTKRKYLNDVNLSRFLN